MQIGVIGTGYVGLVAGVCLADAGNLVTCVDSDPEKVRALHRGEIPIYEPGLGGLLHRSQREHRITFTTDHSEAVRGADVVFVAVGTPEGPDGAPDLSYLQAAVKDVVAAADGPLVLVLKSTVPVGTAAWVKGIIAEITKYPLHVVNNPEFLKEGDAMDDFLRPDRVVVGCDSDEAWKVMQEIYAPFVRSGKPVLRMSNEAAEITKYAANAMLATRISFMNEVSRLCDKLGVDVEEVRKGVGTDSRIGSAFLYAGCGYGGSCFPKDTQAFLHTGRQHGIPMEIVEAAERVNDAQKLVIFEKVKVLFGADLKGKRFALWGLAFKPQTDDVREAPALVVARELVRAGAEVVGVDPEGSANFAKACEVEIQYADDPYEAATGADAVLLLTEWNEYRSPDLKRLKGLMKSPVFLDGRNILDPVKTEAAGFTYRGIGRGNGGLAADARAADATSSG
jgi:UDPglucose 6-dehydrogenase